MLQNSFIELLYNEKLPNKTLGTQSNPFYFGEWHVSKDD